MISENNTILQIKVSKLEKQFIDKYCTLCGISISEYGHLAILEKVLTTPSEKMEESIIRDRRIIKTWRKKTNG